MNQLPSEFQRQHVADGDAISLPLLVGSIRRRRRFIATAVLASVLAAAVYVFVLATPVYKATSVVILQSREEQVLNLASVMGQLGTTTPEVNSEVEVLKSRTLLGRVVDQLDLTAHPDFNAALRTPGLKARILDHIRTPAAPLSPDAAQVAQREAAIDALLGSITILNAANSLVFRIAAENGDPQLAVALADSVAEQYVQDQIGVKFAATEQATSWLANRVQELQSNLQDAEAKLKTFNGQTELVSTEQLRTMERQLKGLRERSIDVESASRADASRLQLLETSDDPTARARATEDAALIRMAETNPRAAGLAAALSRAEAQLREQVDRDMRQVATFQSSLRDLQTQVDRQNADLIVLQQLTRERDASAVLYEHFLTRLKETSAQQGVQQPDSRILSQAVLPGAPASPRKGLTLAAAGILGLVFALGVTLARELRNTTFRSARDLSEFSGLDVIGQMPRARLRMRRRLLDHINQKPGSAEAEAVRDLRTSILLSRSGRVPKVIACTSALAGEGKTVTTISLAQNFAALNRRVLLIEADLRRSVFAECFDGIAGWGLADLLEGRVKLDEIIRQNDGGGIDVIPGGKASLNPADLLASERFVAMLEEMRASYDLILIDTPPVLAVPDGRMIAQVADATFFVVAWDQTTKGQVAESLRLFDNARLKVSGMILTKIDPKVGKDYASGYGYGYAYGPAAG